jgi:hypothetical protein
MRTPTSGRSTSRSYKLVLSLFQQSAFVSRLNLCGSSPLNRTNSALRLCAEGSFLNEAHDAPEQEVSHTQGRRPARSLAGKPPSPFAKPPVAHDRRTAAALLPPIDRRLSSKFRAGRKFHQTLIHWTASQMSLNHKTSVCPFFCQNVFETICSNIIKVSTDRPTTVYSQT